MKAIAEPNVDVHFTDIEEITSDSIVGADGSVASKLDTIVCATGFDTSFLPRFTLIGQNGVSMKEKFTPEPHSYFGVSAPSKIDPLQSPQNG